MKARNPSFSGGQETGENAPDSWAACTGDSLPDSVKKSLSRPVQGGATTYKRKVFMRSRKLSKVALTCEALKLPYTLKKTKPRPKQSLQEVSQGVDA
ncbi:hypothetical protein M3558_11970 [Brevibacillus invocatus]|nr:hypothetical protein [Brevibacillus invocatus]